MAKIILDLCGGSGSWSKPYADAGYKVINVTLPEFDVRDFTWTGEKVWGILAAPPCESFSNARRGHPVYNQSMCRKDGLDIVRACMRIIKECDPEWWALENPATGDLERYLGKPNMTFQPYEYGDGWAKKNGFVGKVQSPKKDLFCKESSCWFAWFICSSWSWLPVTCVSTQISGATYTAISTVCRFYQN